jgi:hypothetical protein
MFYAPGLVFDYTEGAGCRFYVLRSRSRFQRYRGSWVLFSCFALPDSFSVVPSALDLMPSVPPKMSSGTQNMKTGPGTLRTAENESRNEKNMKTGDDTLGSIENESWRAKHENRTRRPRYRQKRVRESKT